MKTLFTTIILVLWQSYLWSQVLAAWTFENASSVPASVSASTKAARVSTATADLSGAASIGSPAVCTGAKTWATNFWPTSTEADPGYYYSFTVQAAAGYYLDVRKCSFKFSRSSEYSPWLYRIAYSVDGQADYVAYNGSTTSIGSCGGVGIFTGAVSQEGGSIEFKVFFFGQSPAGLAATIRIDDVILEGGALLLPVEITQFTGDAHDQGITLHWTTASERQNARFEIERSFDGQHFRTLGEVPGQGNSAAPIHYRFEDIYPYPGVNYYRLKQVDANEEATHSAIIAVSATNTYTSGIRVFPNPVQSRLTIQLPEHLSTDARLTCLSWQGVPVQIYPIHPDQRVLEMDLGKAPPGAYLLLVRDRDILWHTKFLKSEF